MSRSTVYKRCSLCFTKFEPDGGELIWKDSMQLCPKCYTRYNASAYNQRVMLINSIKCYRRLIGKYEDKGNIFNTFIPKGLISLTLPKLCSKDFKGEHFLGGRFVPKKLFEKFNLNCDNLYKKSPDLYVKI